MPLATTRSRDKLPIRLAWDAFRLSSLCGQFVFVFASSLRFTSIVTTAGKLVPYIIYSTCIGSLKSPFASSQPSNGLVRRDNARRCAFFIYLCSSQYSFTLTSHSESRWAAHAKFGFSTRSRGTHASHVTFPRERRNLGSVLGSTVTACKFCEHQVQ